MSVAKKEKPIKPTIVLISKDKRDKIKKDVADLFVNTNHEGYAEAVLHAVECFLLEIFGQKDANKSGIKEDNPEDKKED